jgi:hypothetical protein
MLKKISGVASIFVLMFCAILSVSAQENQFKPEDLQALIKSASENLKGKTYRVTTKTVYSNQGSIDAMTQKTITEYLPPDREHFISETETSEGVERYETISIGERKYIKNDKGIWQEMRTIINGNGMGSGSGDGSGDYKIETTVERKLIKSDIVGKQKADLYETVTTTRIIYPMKTFTSVSKESYWFDRNKLFVKRESVQTSQGETIYFDTKTYEYDSKIKIEAPVTGVKTK